jgi:hypothetical protein
MKHLISVGSYISELAISSFSFTSHESDLLFNHGVEMYFSGLSHYG